jgi:2-hydroxychromene-2-carboxylate isomerase
MPGPIRFYFDFASPYAYFAAGEIDAIGEKFGRTVEWRPILMWAVLKAHGIAAPMDVPVKRGYLLHDMKRSAAFFGVPYVEPVKLPLSSHLAARLILATGMKDARAASTLTQRLFKAFFADRRDIADEETLIGLAGNVGIERDDALSSMKGNEGRTLLEHAVVDAVKSGVVGSPYFLVDEEGFFGADRLPQLKWFLARSGQ